MKNLKSISVKLLCCSLLLAVQSGCAAIAPAAKTIAQKAAVYLCTKAICKSDGNLTP